MTPNTKGAKGGGGSGGEAEGLQALLEYLKQNRGFDFTGYKRTSLERRIQKRMAEVGIEGYGDYQDHLEVNPEEFTDLFNTILINVTAFFRDKSAWDYLSSTVLPKLLEDRPDEQPIRVWCAACASGEEAYTTAIVLTEAMGEEQYRRRVKIYATDVDEEALAQARQAVYSTDALEPVPKELAERYFEPNPLGKAFRGDLRRSVIFGRNDLVQDAPIPRIDLLISRNALMYFTPETQARILGHFNFALSETGFLFLGKSEMLITHADLFTPVDMKARVFRKVPRLGLRDRLAFVTEGGGALAGGNEMQYAELTKGAFDVYPAATVVVDRNGFVTSANIEARRLFEIGTADVGRPLQDLELSYRPVELRSAIESAYEQRSPFTLERVAWTPPGSDSVTLDVTVTPMPGNNGGSLGVTITFADVTEHARLEEEHERSKRQLETAYEELQSTVEELETTNEELHSTNEELETTNEELQSSNEELETMNEELQSTNDELEAMNEEQRGRGEELDRVNLFLEGILGNLGVGVVVLDSEQRVQVWNASSTDLWGLRPEEAEGTPFLSLDIGLPVEGLKDVILASEARGEVGELTLDAISRRGRSFECYVRVLPLRRESGEVYGTILLMGDRALSTVFVPSG
jgi:two-component system, chemotaxis family, CheB/CheR fusion protein